MPIRRRMQKQTDSTWPSASHQAKSPPNSKHDSPNAGHKSSPLQTRPFITSVEQSTQSTTGLSLQAQSQSTQFDLTQFNLFANHSSQLNPATSTAQATYIQRECGVDESCPAGMEYASSWDNNDPTSSHSGSVNASGNLSYGYSWGQQNTVGIDNDTYMSTSSGYNAGASFNPNNGQVGITGGYSQSTQIGEQTDTRGVGGSGYLDFNSRGELEGGGGTANVTANGTSINIGGGILVSAQPPRLDTDGRYIVTWKREYTVSAGGGHTNASGRGGSASYGGKESTTGSRKFDTQSAAQAFYDGGVWASLDPEDASQLQAGDQISQTDSDQITGGASAQAMGLTVGANITVGDSHSVEVTGLGNQRVSVKVLDSSILGGALSLGAPGVSMTGGLQSTDSNGYIVTFDLSTAAGQSAFQYLTRQGQLPPGGRGYTLKANIEGSQTEESSGFSLAGTSVTNKNTTSETTTTYAADQRTVEERTGAESSGVTVPFLGSFSESDQLTATDDSSASNRTYSVSSNVNSSSTEDVNKELARSTGVHFNSVSNELANQQSRRWTVTSSFSQAQIERLVREIRRGNWNHHSLIYESGDGADFAAEVRAAGDDWDRIDRALTAFVSETGDSGLDLIRSTLGISPRYSLTLQGDPYMTGEAGHTALAQKLRGWTTRLDNQTSPREVGAQIATELRQQRTRLTAISDPERYPDLPNELRGQEMTRTEGEIAELETLQTRARDLVQQNNQSDQMMSVDPSLDPTANSCEMTDAQAVSLEWDAINAFETRVTNKRTDCADMGNDARRAHWIHRGAYTQGPRSAYETWGERHWYGDDDHAAQYESAKSALDSGNSAWQKAEELWGDYRAAKSRLEFTEPAQIVGTLDSTLGDQLVKTFNKFSLARGLYQTALRRYDTIREAHPEAVNNQFYAYTHGHQLPDELKLE
ncbi:serine-rich family protein [Leptothoe spongobia]|uniref:Uncharacterized protein n=1 Tax=Leptothoe spongobia TAU-MAC 1115 TaxID=1967444 RepID=A0A947GKD3_9CYAN|nr:hypothetical protein [Leptothoe spongobia]MBT9316648.1 hypothetical protein [Leptothoe spongobia TAU-MAC 1115]